MKNEEEFDEDEVAFISQKIYKMLKGNEQNMKNGGELIKLGGVLQHWAHQGPSESFIRKQPARLGKLGHKHLPYFCYK